MRRRWRNGANPCIVPSQGRGGNSRNRAHGRDALSGGSGGGSRGGWVYSNSSGRGRGGWDYSGNGAWIRAAGRGRRGMDHPRSETVSSSGLHHGWAREGEEEERELQTENENVN